MITCIQMECFMPYFALIIMYYHVKIACYQLPSSPLGGAIPLTHLFPNTSLFSLPPRVFGYTAFVQDYTPSLSKLAPCALKGVFVGYSCMQKGYRVYFPDVTFHEDIPSFSSSTTPLRAPISPPWFSLYSSLLLVAFSGDL